VPMKKGDSDARGGHYFLSERSYLRSSVVCTLLGISLLLLEIIWNVITRGMENRREARSVLGTRSQPADASRLEILLLRVGVIVREENKVASRIARCVGGVLSFWG